MYLSKGVVVQGRRNVYEYAITMFYKGYMKHGLPLTGMNHPTENIMISKYTTDMLNCYHGSQTQESEQCISPLL